MRVTKTANAPPKPIDIDYIASFSLDGGTGDDNYSVSRTQHFLFKGNAGDDRLEIYDALAGKAYGGSGDDALFVSGKKYAIVDGGSGDDQLRAGGRHNDDNTVFLGFGGSGNDYVLLESASIVRVRLGSGDDHFGTEDQAGTDVFVSGGTGDDTIVGTSGQDSLHGDSGDDLIYADCDNADPLDEDTLDGGKGNDTIEVDGGGLSLSFGKSGDDSLSGGYYMFGGSGNDTIVGRADDSTQAQADGGTGNDVIRGANYVAAGLGQDTVSATSTWDTIWLGNDSVRDVLYEAFHAGTTDYIYQYEDGIDRIVMKQPAITLFSQIQLTDTVDAGHAVAVLTFDTGTIRLYDVTSAQLNAEDFLFNPP